MSDAAWLPFTRLVVISAGGAGARRCTVILPLSPNHGLFGGECERTRQKESTHSCSFCSLAGDGLYSESKLALECLFAKWHSEGFGQFFNMVRSIFVWVVLTCIPCLADRS